MARKSQPSEDGKKKALKNAQRLDIYHQILMQQPKIVDIKQKDDFELLYQTNIKTSIKDIILSGEWMK